MSRLLFLRHSSRLDWSRSDVSWEDSATRPHDTPIDDHELPKDVAKSLKAAGFNITHIWSSPYRRCLQTAAAAARELGVGSISVHHGLSEGTSSAISCAHSVGVDPEFIRSGAEPMYLKPEGKVAAVGDGIAVVDVDVGHYCDEAIEGGAFARFKSAFTDVRRAHSTTEGAGDVLIVTHWEGVAVAGALLSEAPVRVTNVEFCGVIAADAAMSRVVHAHRVNMLKRTGKY